VQSLAMNGYSVEQVKAALHAPLRKLSFRYELLDERNSKKRDLTNVLNGSISYNALADIKRTARFTMANTGFIERKNAVEEVLWKNVQGSSVFPGTIQKTLATNNWGDAGALSAQKIEAGMDAYVETVVGETNTSRMIGFNSNNSSAHWDDLDFAFYLQMTGELKVYEFGAYVSTVGAYSTGDVLKISIDNGVVNYWKNGDLVYTSLNRPTFPLWVDCSIYGAGGTLQSVRIGGRFLSEEIDFLKDRIKPYVRLEMPPSVISAVPPDFSRSSSARDRYGYEVAADLPRFGPGKIQQAILIEEGTTNLINSQGDGADKDWTKWNHFLNTNYWSAAAQIDDPIMGKVFQGTAQDSPYLYDYSAYSFSANTTYTLSVYLKADRQKTVTLMGYLRGSSGANLATQNKSVTLYPDKWVRVDFQLTPGQNDSGAGIGIWFSYGNTGTVYFAAQPQLEPKQHATSYIDGTRSAEVLTVPTTEVLFPAEGTVEMWLYVDSAVHGANTGWMIPFATADVVSNPTYAEQNQLSLRKKDRSATWSVFTSDATGATTTIDYPAIETGWHHFAFRWKAGVGLKLYLDGAVVRQPSPSDRLPSSFHPTLYIGSWVNGQNQANTFIDDVRISSVARSDVEILASAKGRAKVDQHTTYKLDLDGNLNAQTYKKSGYVEWPQGVFLLSTPPQKVSPTGVITREVEAYDLLQILLDDKIEQVYAVNQGTNYIVAVKNLLDSAGLTGQNLTATNKTIPATRDWPPGTPKLKIINELLEAINYMGLHMDENGNAVAQPYVSPVNRASEYTYRDDEESVLFPEMEYSLDLFGVPNKWVLVVSEPDRPPLVSIYTNSNPNSPTSTVSRGRTIVDHREGLDAADQATLDALAQRFAFEASQVYEQVDFFTAIMPFHSHADVYTLEYSTLGVAHKYSEVQWDYELKAGAKMKHRIRRVVSV